MEELNTYNYPKVLKCLIPALFIAVILHSCTQQISLAKSKWQEVLQQDTLKVPKQYRPSQLQISRQQNRELQRQINPLQKQLQQDLPEVLTRSKKAFGEISDIKGMLDYMNSNSISERDFLFQKAVDIRALNDSLIRNQIVSNKNINRLISIVLSERDARIANEVKTADDRKLNQSNIKAQNLYTGILFSLLIALLIILLFMWLDVKRIKAKYKQQLQNG